MTYYTETKCLEIIFKLHIIKYFSKYKFYFLVCVYDWVYKPKQIVCINTSIYCLIKMKKFKSFSE